MRTFLAVLAGFVLVGVAVVNEKQQTTNADDAAQETVAAEQEVIESKPTVIRLPVIESEPTAAIHIDEALKTQLDELTTRVDSTEERLTVLEQTVEESAAQSVQVGRVAMIESQLEDAHLRIDETQALLTNGIEELKAAIAAIPEPIVQQAAPIEEIAAELDWTSIENEKYLLLFTTTDCPPCETAKNEVVPWLEDANWKIEVFQDGDEAYEMFNVTGPFPTWVGLKNGQEVVRWTGASKPATREILLDVYGYGTSITETVLAAPSAVLTFEPEPQYSQPSLKSWIQAHSNGVEYGISGSIRGHLLDHGWSSSELAGLSNREMLELHDATHQGTMTPSRYRNGDYSNTYSTSYASNSNQNYSYSNCTSGNCGNMTRREVRAMNRQYGRGNW